MDRVRSILITLTILWCGYVFVLFGLSWLLHGRIEEEIKEKIRYALQTDEVQIDNVELSFIRGRVEVRGLSARSSGPSGSVNIEIDSFAVDMAMLGTMVIDRNPRKIVVDNAHVNLSALGALRLRSRESVPRRVDTLVVKNSTLTFVVSDLIEGAPRGHIAIHNSQADDVQLGDMLSWLQNTKELDGTVGVGISGDVGLRIRFREGEVTVQGGMWGPEPIVWPMTSISGELDSAALARFGGQLLRELRSMWIQKQARSMWDRVSP